MTDPKETARLLYAEPKKLAPNQVAKRAEKISPDKTFVLAVVREYSELSTRAAQFNADMNSIMKD